MPIQTIGNARVQRKNEADAAHAPRRRIGNALMIDKRSAFANSQHAGVTQRRVYGLSP
jgi:hypothetical protein